MPRNKEKLIREMMENYPEAGSGNSLICTGWDYEIMNFDFVDSEDDKKYNVNLKALKKGLRDLLKIIEDGEYFNDGVCPHLLSDGYNYDAQDCDALVQCAIFGEVRYG